VRHYFLHQAKAAKGKRRVVFAEGEETKIIRAAAQVCSEGIGEPILLGRPEVIKKRAEELGVECQGQLIDPRKSELRESYAEAYYQTRQRKGVTLQYANKQLADANVFGLMMVKQGDADAFVSGLTHDYPEVIRPALQIHHTAEGMQTAAGVYIMILNDEVFLFTDATVNIEPNAEDLSEIACMAADFAAQLGLNPRVAMLSFSNFGSTPHPLSNKVRKAVEMVKTNRPDIAIDGEMQADTAVVIDIIEERYPFSSVKDANVLVFPSLESANIAYKLLHRLGKAQMIGPILLGIGAPVHVLQTGDDVRNIVNIAAIAVMDAEKRSKK